MENNSFNVAVLGAGNIGSAVVARLMDLDKGIVRLNVKKILVRDTKKGRDISKDLFNHDLELRIQELESKFSKDLSETTFNKLKELKNERKTN